MSRWLSLATGLVLIAGCSNNQQSGPSLPDVESVACSPSRCDGAIAEIATRVAAAGSEQADALALTVDGERVWFVMDLQPLIDEFEGEGRVAFLVEEATMADFEEGSGQAAYVLELSAVGCRLTASGVPRVETCVAVAGLFDPWLTASSGPLAYEAELNGLTIRTRPGVGDLVLVTDEQ